MCTISYKTETWGDSSWAIFSTSNFNNSNSVSNSRWITNKDQEEEKAWNKNKIWKNDIAIIPDFPRETKLANQFLFL